MYNTPAQDINLLPRVYINSQDMYILKRQPKNGKN
jgi:hypothetical protein